MPKHKDSKYKSKVATSTIKKDFGQVVMTAFKNAELANLRLSDM